jgi:TIR domain
VKVFISWSGEPSKSIARALDSWLEEVVQAVDAWMSDAEITSGARWNDAIAKSLSETNFGIVCVTRANQHAPWLIFEAGALAKSVETARVVPLCIDLSPAEVTGPLVAFQARELNEAGMRRLVHDLSASSENPKDLGAVFDAMWPQLEAAVMEAINAAPPDTEPRRSAEAMLEELVERVRRLDRRTEDQEPKLLFRKTGEVVFTMGYVEQGLGSKKTYAQGTSGLITHVHRDPADQVTHLDIRLPDGQFVRKVPVDYFTP